MRIAIFSDTHLGYGYGTKRQEDCFIQAKEALDLSEPSDALLLAGDLFDSRVPKPEVFARALKMFSNSNTKDTGVTVVSVPREVFVGPKPVVGIFGTHERRGVGLVNPVQALESAEFLVCLQCETMILEKDGSRIAVHGMSGVPEQFTKETLAKWNPQPVPGCVNILMMHQNLCEYVFADDISLKLKDLPAGFDLIIFGHIHKSEIVSLDQGGKLLITGSTICTQQRVSEMEPKRVFFFDTVSKEITSKELRTPRALIIETLEFSKALPTEVVKRVEEKVREISSKEYSKPPLVRVIISGSLAGEYTQADVALSNLNSLEGADILLSVDKTLTSDKNVKTHLKLKELRENKMSIEEVGMTMLQDNIKSKGFMPVQELFELLLQGDQEKIMERITGQNNQRS